MPGWRPTRTQALDRYTRRVVVYSQPGTPPRLKGQTTCHRSTGDQDSDGFYDRSQDGNAGMAAWTQKGSK